MHPLFPPALRLPAVLFGAVLALGGCGHDEPSGAPLLRWYVFDEPSGAFVEATRRCNEAAAGRYRIETVALPADADQQREQLVRRLAARDTDIDLIGMDVIWTAEFAAAGWILPWEGTAAAEAAAGRIAATLDSATYDGRLWAVPFTSNAQLLWFRTDRVATPPSTWDDMLDQAEALGRVGTIQAQGQRYEGLTVFFASLLASAGGAILSDDGTAVALPEQPTRRALAVMRALATSPAADPGLPSNREDEARLGFESGGSTFMINYTFVWSSARSRAPELAAHMGWSRWPRVEPERPSRVTLGGLNIGVGAYTRRPALAFEAAACIAQAAHQRLAAVRGALPPTIDALYQDPEVRAVLPFADSLRATLRDAVQRPQTPLYNDVSLAISHTLHPMRSIDPERDVQRLRKAVGRALRSEGLL